MSLHARLTRQLKVAEVLAAQNERLIVSCRNTHARKQPVMVPDDRPAVPRGRRT